MGLQSTDDVRERESLMDSLDILLANDEDVKYMSFVNKLRAPKNPVTAQKAEWQDIGQRLISITCTASGGSADWDTDSDITALPITGGDEAYLREGDILLLADDGKDSEQVVVKTVNSGSIDVYARGHGSSTAAAQGTSAFEALVIGNAQIEDDDPIDAYFQGLTERYNYTQIFEDVAGVSGTVRRSRITGGDYEATQIMVKFKELLRGLNRSVIYGLRNLDATNDVATMGGIREWLSSTYNINGAISIAKLEAMAAQAIAAGCNPKSIHVSPDTAADINALYVGNVRYEPGANRVGLQVAKIVLAGGEVEMYPDRDVDDAEVLMIDSDRVFLAPLAGGQFENGEFATYPLYDKRNGKQHSTQIVGEYTTIVRNPAGAGVRGYGKTG